MWNAYDIMKEALHDGDPHEYYQSMLRMIQDEMQPMTELQIPRRRRRAHDMVNYFLGFLWL